MIEVRSSRCTPTTWIDPRRRTRGRSCRIESRVVRTVIDRCPVRPRAERPRTGAESFRGAGGEFRGGGDRLIRDEVEREVGPRPADPLVEFDQQISKDVGMPSGEIGGFSEIGPEVVQLDSGTVVEVEEFPVAPTVGGERLDPRALRAPLVGHVPPQAPDRQGILDVVRMKQSEQRASIRRHLHPKRVDVVADALANANTFEFVVRTNVLAFDGLVVTVKFWDNVLPNAVPPTVYPIILIVTDPLVSVAFE